MDSPIKILLVLIPAMPLAATLLTAVLGRHVLRGRSHLPTVAAIAISCLASLFLVASVQSEADRAKKDNPQSVGYHQTVTLWSWAVVEGALQQHSAAGSEERSAAGESAVPPAAGDAVPPAAGDAVPPAAGDAVPPAAGDAVPPARDFRIDITLRADPLTAFMLATVTFVSLLVAVYSIGYMHDDPGYWRFFTYISLFVFSMTMLVSASNFVLLYVFWEAVGLCSYLLIGFWYRKPEAAAAGKKAFLVNRVGDFGFALGVFLIWTTFGTLNFHDTKVVEQTELFEGRQFVATRVVADSEVGDAKVVGGQAGVLGQTILREEGGYRNLYEQIYNQRWGWVATAICLLLMLGACGKSAQFPLHVWLPDAMEGPTPVSALIHAATMVTAGVYMVARCMPLFVASDYALQVVAVIGGFTALLAALIALTQTDLKRILAYSTISQLGYMFLGLGAVSLLSVSGAVAGMFHLFTHAFFKALLFLGAGSVMHAMGGVIDVRRFGGLRRLMPRTHWTFLVGCLALAGIFPLAGFWSKDVILAAVNERGHEQTLYFVLYLAGLFTAFLTAFYTFRAYFLTFHGEEKIPSEAGHHAHESPNSMTVPLMILAVFALGVGAVFEFTHGFGNFLEGAPSLAYLGSAEHGKFHWDVAIISTAIALAGAALAGMLYLGKREVLEGLTRAMDSARLYRLSHQKFFFDEIYGLLVVKPLEVLAGLCYLVDRFLVDGLVNACGLLPKLIGAALRPLQNGMVQFYALAMVLGLLVLLGALLM